MTRNYYATGIYNPDHSTFGGMISNGDFCTEYSQKPGEHIKDIISDWTFDKRCKRNVENRDRNKNYKKGTK